MGRLTTDQDALLFAPRVGSIFTCPRRLRPAACAPFEARAPRSGNLTPSAQAYLRIGVVGLTEQLARGKSQALPHSHMPHSRADVERKAWLVAQTQRQYPMVVSTMVYFSASRGYRNATCFQISFIFIFLSMLRLKSRGPPKKRISDGVIGMPCASRNSIRCNVHTRSAI